MLILIWPLFILLKLALGVIGIIAAPLYIATGWRWLWLWGNDEKGFTNDDFEEVGPLLWDRIVRNASGNTKYALEKVFGDPRDYDERSNFKLKDLEYRDPMEAPGFKIRYRRVGALESIRITYGEPHARDGKKEYYGGFKIGSNVPGFGFTWQGRGVGGWLIALSSLALLFGFWYWLLT